MANNSISYLINSDSHINDDIDDDDDNDYVINNHYHNANNTTIFMPLLEKLNLNDNNISNIDDTNTKTNTNTTTSNNNNDTKSNTNTNDTSFWANFPILMELFLAYNKIGTIASFATISHLHRLRVLEIQNNPVFNDNNITNMRKLLALLSRSCPLYKSIFKNMRYCSNRSNPIFTFNHHYRHFCGFITTLSIIDKYNSDNKNHGYNHNNTLLKCLQYYYRNNNMTTVIKYHNYHSNHKVNSIIYPDPHFAVVAIQTWIRTRIKKRHYTRTTCIVLVQANARRFLCQLHFLKTRSAIMIQSLIRCFIHRRNYISSLHLHEEIRRMNLTNRIRLDIAKLVSNRNISIGTSVTTSSITTNLERKRYEMLLIEKSLKTVASRTVGNIITSVTIGTALIIRARRNRILPLIVYYLKGYCRRFRLKKSRRNAYAMYINDLVQRATIRQQMIAEYTNSMIKVVMDRKLGLQNFVEQAIGTALLPYITR
jgi:hypothetical protein